MAELKNCRLPDDLRYHVDFNLWARDNGDGTCDIGMTDIAQTMAGALLHCRAKKVGKSVAQGKSLATIESGKWVGPLKSPFPCEIVARNEAVEARAALVNESPYDDGWVVRVKPQAGATAIAALLAIDAAVEGFKAYMAEHGVEGCGSCPEPEAEAS